MTDYPALLKLPEQGLYKDYFEKEYCKRPVITFDNIPVFFHRSKFEHAFFESSDRAGNKDTFSLLRAERMPWIKTTLKDPNADLYFGWDNKKKKHDLKKRVAVVQGNYVVIISLNKTASKAFFVTAFVADSGRSIRMIKQNPKWHK